MGLAMVKKSEDMFNRLHTIPAGWLNARVMETVGNAFYGGLECAGNGNSVYSVRKRRIMETACKQRQDGKRV